MPYKPPPFGLFAKTACLKQYKRCNLVHYKSDAPRHQQLENGGKAHPCPTSRFLADRSESRRTGNIEQAEHHQAEGMERPEANTVQCRCKSTHPLWRAGVDNAEQHSSAGHHHFLGRDTGNQSHGNLPKAQADGGKEGNQPFTKHSPETLCHIRGIALGAKV